MRTGLPGTGALRTADRGNPRGARARQAPATIAAGHPVAAPAAACVGRVGATDRCTRLVAGHGAPAAGSLSNASGGAGVGRHAASWARNPQSRASGWITPTRGAVRWLRAGRVRTRRAGRGD